MQYKKLKKYGLLFIALTLFTASLLVSAEEVDLKQSAFPSKQEEKVGNAAVYYNKAFNLCVYDYKSPLVQEANVIIKNGWKEENKALEELLKQNEPAFIEFEKGIILDKCDFAFGKVYENPYEQPIPPLVKARNLTNLLILKGRLYERQNNYEEAIRQYLSVLNFAEHIYQENYLISAMLGVAMEGMVSDSLHQYLEQKNIDPKLCKQILLSLQKINSKNMLVEAMEQEKNAYLRMGNYLFKNQDELFRKSAKEAFKEKGDKYYNLVITVVKTNSENDKKIFQDTIVLASKKYNSLEGALNAILSSLQNNSVKPQQKVAEEIAELMAVVATPGLIRADEAYYFTDAKIKVLETAAAIRLFIADNKKLPETLDNLVPNYLANIPIDPWSQQPLKYIKKDNSFIVYSVGSDRKDNNGQGTGYEGMKELEGKDIVFSMSL